MIERTITPAGLRLSRVDPATGRVLACIVGNPGNAELVRIMVALLTRKASQ